MSRTIAAGQEVRGIAKLYVATDDERVAAEAHAAGAETVMTSPECRNGTERVAEVVASLPQAPSTVINLQGDAPLTPPRFLEALLDAFSTNPQIKVATPVLPTGEAHLERLRRDQSAGRAGATTVVTDVFNRALYFSKTVLPFGASTKTPVLHHVGVYAYASDALQQYAKLPEGRAERSEGLEQLRFLENGIPVHCIEVDAGGQEFWEVNHPEDVAIVERILNGEMLP